MTYVEVRVTKKKNIMWKFAEEEEEEVGMDGSMKRQTNKLTLESG